MNVSATASSTSRKRKLFLGWPMVVLTFCLAVVTQGFGIYHFSMLKDMISEATGAGPTEVAFAYSFYALSMAFVGLFVGDTIGKIGIRKVLVASAVLYGGGFLLLSTVDNLPMLYLTYIIMGAGSSCGGVVVITGIPSNWFVKHRGTANGIIWSATFVGSLFVTNFIAFMTTTARWQDAAVWLAAIAAVIILAVSLFLRWRPQEMGLLPDGLTPEEAAAERENAGSAKNVGLTRSQAVRTRTFWVLGAAIFLTGIGEMGVFQNMASYVVSLGNPITVAASLMSLIGLIGFFGKNLGGICIDRFGTHVTYLIIEAIAAAGLVMLAFMSSGSHPVYVYVAIALFGIGENAAIVCFSAGTSKFLGVKNYAQIFGFVFLAKAVGDAVGSPLIAALAQSPIGWAGAFLVAAAACLVSAVLFFFAKKERALIALEEEAAREMAQDNGPCAEMAA